MGAALPLGLPFRWVPSLSSSGSSRAPAGRAAVVRRARQRAKLGPRRWAPPLPSSGSIRAPAVPSWGASTMGAALPLGLPFRWVPSLSSSRAPAGPSCHCLTRAPAVPSWGPRRWAPRCRWGCRSGGCRRCLPSALQRGRAAIVRRARQRAELGASTVGAALPLGLPFRWVPSLPSWRAPAGPSWAASTVGAAAAVGAAVPVGAVAVFLALQPRASGPSCRCPTRASGPSWGPRRWAPPLPSLRSSRAPAVPSWGASTMGAALPLGLPFRWAPPLPSWRAPAARAAVVRRARASGPSWGASTMGAAAVFLGRQPRASGAELGSLDDGRRRCLPRAPAARQRGRAGSLDALSLQGPAHLHRSTAMPSATFIPTAWPGFEPSCLSIPRPPPNWSSTQIGTVRPPGRWARR